MAKKIASDLAKASAGTSRKATEIALTSAGVADIGAVLWQPTNRPSGPSRPPERRAIDVGSLITRALTAAGLMK